MLVYKIKTILILVKLFNFCSIVTSSCQRIQYTTLVKARFDHDFAFIGVVEQQYVQCGAILLKLTMLS